MAFLALLALLYLAAGAQEHVRRTSKNVALLGFNWVYLLVYLAAGAQEHVDELQRQGLQGAVRAGAPFTRVCGRQLPEYEALSY